MKFRIKRNGQMKKMTLMRIKTWKLKNDENKLAFKVN